MDLEAEGDDDDGGSEVEEGLEDEDVEVAGKRKAGGKVGAGAGAVDGVCIAC